MTGRPWYDPLPSWVVLLAALAAVFAAGYADLHHDTLMLCPLVH